MLQSNNTSALSILFSLWSQKAELEHPDLTFVAPTSTTFLMELIDDGRECFKKSKLPDIKWQIFIDGYLTERLNYHWYHQYISPHSEDRKQISCLKGILTLLMENDALADEADQISIASAKNDGVDISDIRSYSLSFSEDGVRYHLEESDSPSISAINTILSEKIMNTCNRSTPQYIKQIPQLILREIKPGL